MPSFLPPFYIIRGKAFRTPDPALPRPRSSLLRLRPWSPWLWSPPTFATIGLTEPHLLRYRGFSIFLTVFVCDRYHTKSVIDVTLPNRGVLRLSFRFVRFPPKIACMTIVAARHHAGDSDRGVAIVCRATRHSIRW